MSHVLKFMSNDLFLGKNAQLAQGYVSKITEIEKQHPHFEKSKLKFAIEFKVKTDDGVIAITEETLPTLSAKNWDKRFFRKEYEGSDGNMYTNLLYTRYQTLNALVKIFEAKGNGEILAGMEAGELDIDKFLKQTFDVVVVVTDEFKFIDWVSTFQANGVEIPKLFPETQDKQAPDNTDVVESKLDVKPGEAAQEEGDPLRF